MPLKVEIDKRSGFCGGVIRAIGRAEEFLDSHPGEKLYSLGAIVHNEAELKRLEAKGLVTVSHEDLRNLPPSANILIRAHGEPPETYALASAAGLHVIDCTCPVVIKLQSSIRQAYAGLNSESLDCAGVATPATGQIIIFGKVGHPEVMGLLGQVGGDAVVVENIGMLEEAIEDGRIRTDMPLEIFSQTTKSPTEYSEICKTLSESAKAGLTVHQTVCSQVASRHEELSDFAASHDVIIFVSGASSSNGKVLCELCRSFNPRTHHISEPDDLDPTWFGPDESVGICGATSTPRWLLDQVAEAVRSIVKT